MLKYYIFLVSKNVNCQHLFLETTLNIPYITFFSLLFYVMFKKEYIMEKNTSGPSDSFHFATR